MCELDHSYTGCLGFLLPPHNHTTTWPYMALNDSYMPLHEPYMALLLSLYSTKQALSHPAPDTQWLSVCDCVCVCVAMTAGSSTVTSSFALLREAETKLKEVVRTNMATAMTASDHPQVERSALTGCHGNTEKLLCCLQIFQDISPPQLAPGRPAALYISPPETGFL